MLAARPNFESFAILIHTLEYSVDKYERKFLNRRIDLNLKMNQYFSELRVIGKK
jgi:hypothetical protein